MDINETKIITKGMNSIMNTYSRFPLVLEKGEGCYVYDTGGKKYLDFVAGIAVNSLGHGNEKLVSAVASQAKDMIHVSNLYWTRPQITLAEKLTDHSIFDKAFFCNSGAEAVEGSLKLARKYASRHHPERFEIISMKDSFHGRTFGAVTATGQTKYQKGLSPLLPGVIHVTYNDIEALKAAAGEKTCAILLEPIQGEGGVHPADAEYLSQVRELCDAGDIVLIFDEIQCGVGRTGTFFAFEQYGISPDAAALAKGIAGGVPMGVILAKDNFAEAFSPGDHASTFGGNPLAAAAANVVLDELFDNGVLEHVKSSGAYLQGKLESLRAQMPEKISDVRGLGLMLGLELTGLAAPVIHKCIENGLLLVSAGPNVIRFVPPLIVSEAEIDQMTDILHDALL
ncbi:MAG: aspartate aminotransferase family protein [Clostridiales bacterium]|jgi:predicted acetylornithine/succinylornithine family transaminase|nr:aspartate aminotransferase family protein [Clostridiales bacterium]